MMINSLHALFSRLDHEQLEICQTEALEVAKRSETLPKQFQMLNIFVLRQKENVYLQNILMW
jgi:hypothetical protein